MKGAAVERTQMLLKAYRAKRNIAQSIGNCKEAMVQNNIYIHLRTECIILKNMILLFSAAVEACVLHGLKRRAAGFLRSNKIAALFMKVGKTLPLAEDLSRKVQELEQLLESK